MDCDGYDDSVVDFLFLNVYWGSVVIGILCLDLFKCGEYYMGGYGVGNVIG